MGSGEAYQCIAKLAVRDEPAAGYGLRRQSAAATSLWVMASATESGVALRLPPQSKTIDNLDLHRRRALDVKLSSISTGA